MIMRALTDLDQDLYADIGTLDTVANQQEYKLPANATPTPFGGGAIKLLRVEATYDGTNWKVLNSVNIREIPKATQSATQINAQFNTGAPAYAYFNRSLFLYPIPTAVHVAGIRIFYIKRPNEMTAGTALPDMPSDFLDILSLGISVDVYESLSNTSSMNNSLARFNARLLEMKAQESQNDIQDSPRFIAANINYK